MNILIGVGRDELDEIKVIATNSGISHSIIV